MPLVVQATTAPKVVDVFDTPVGVGKPAAVIGSRVDHPVPRTGIVGRTGMMKEQRSADSSDPDRSQGAHRNEQILRCVLFGRSE